MMTMKFELGIENLKYQGLANFETYYTLGFFIVTTVSTQIERQSWLERHFGQIWIKRHFLPQNSIFWAKTWLERHKFQILLHLKLSYFYRTPAFYLRGYGKQ